MDEAHALLKATRATQITLARSCLFTVAERDGIVHSKSLYAYMKEQGLIIDGCTSKWIGVVLRGGPNSPVEWTGEYLLHEDKARNVHGCTVKVWKLREGI